MKIGLKLIAVGVFAFLIIQVILLERGGFSPSVRIRGDFGRSLLSSTLPDVRIVVSDRTMSPGSAHTKNYAFTQDWTGGRVPVWEEAMAVYKGKPGLCYLEIGVFEGRSMTWMLENILTDPTSSAVAIDPFLDDSEHRYRVNLCASGEESRVTTIVGYSQVELRKLPLDSFDIIYVDGSHVAGNVLEDAVLSLRLLKEGGTIIFDDYRWTGWQKVVTPENTPRPAVDIFYAIYGSQLDVVHNGYQAIFRKKYPRLEI
jgi:hypothetical protein